MDGVRLGWRERWSDACRDEGGVGGMEGGIISIMEDIYNTYNRWRDVAM